MRTYLIVLSLASLALAACEPALVSFPADRGHRGDLDALGIELPERPAGVGAGGTLAGPEVGVGFDKTIERPDGTDSAPQLPFDEEDAGCAAVVSQSGWCATLKDHPGPGSGITFVGLDDGATCAPLDAAVGSSVLSVSSLALQGTMMAWCDSTGVVHQVDLASGAVTTTASPGTQCGGLTSAAGGFAALPGQPGRNIMWYSRLSDLVGGEEGVMWPLRPMASRITADTQVVYAAESQTDVVTRWLTDGTELEPLVLDGFSWIHGFDAATEDRMVVLDGQRDLAVYDRVTGALTNTIVLDGQFAGLACFPEP